MPWPISVEYPISSPDWIPIGDPTGYPSPYFASQAAALYRWLGGMASVDFDFCRALQRMPSMWVPAHPPLQPRQKGRHLPPDRPVAGGFVRVSQCVVDDPSKLIDSCNRTVSNEAVNLAAAGGVRVLTRYFASHRLEASFDALGDRHHPSLLNPIESHPILCQSTPSPIRFDSITSHPNPTHPITLPSYPNPTHPITIPSYPNPTDPFPPPSHRIPSPSHPITFDLIQFHSVEPGVLAPRYVTPQQVIYTPRMK